MNMRSEWKFHATHLYPDEMSIYGDMGNIHALRFLCDKLGVEFVYQPVNKGQDLPQLTDWYFIGGGQDQQQYEVCQDLLSKKDQLLKHVQDGVGLLAICGGYQLLGREFITGQGQKIPGIDLFPIITKAPDSNVKSRCIGNLVVECLIPELAGQTLVGFENHGGQTYLIDTDERSNEQKSAYVLGKVLAGFGNNSLEKLEGCVLQNAVGSYLHGSCLPKNPNLATFFLKDSLFKRYGDVIKWSNINLQISQTLHDQLVQRFV